ncbi:molybdate ABC transporter substrate-binding protein [Neobacillus thermocopriae]|nr:molybdate ABC transporter substrate-binding protein [Neobacillus thermocopriae]
MRTLLLTVICVLIIACSRVEQEPSQELKIAAASDLTLAFHEIGQQFEKQTGTKVTFIFGSTGQLAEQIKNGAPFDVFAAANVQYVDELNDKGLIVPDTRQIYAIGRIGIATKADNPLVVQTLEDLLKPEVKKIAIANPNHAPYGLAAKQALEKAGIWEKVKNKLVYGKNISDTFAYIESGNAEAGIIALSLVKKGEVRFQLIDDAMHEPIQQAIAVIKKTKHEKQAQEFIQFLNRSAGQQIMKKYGFVIPKGK